jgi:L-lactate dehydrogenase
MVSRVAIVGTGLVGATTAYALLISGAVPDIVLVDRDETRATGQLNDLRDAAPFGHATRVTLGDLADCAGADIVIVTAGVPQGGTARSRLDDLTVAAGMIREIVGEIARHDPRGIFVVASNPVDVMTYATLKWSGLPASKVIGSGTTLDTSRFCRRLGERYGIAPESVHAYIVGEHGDSQVPLLSSAHIAGLPLEGFCRALGVPYDPEALQTIANETRTAGMEILRAKGATYFGIGAALTRIVTAILRDEHAILTVSTLAPPESGLGDVCLSLPAIIDRGGVSRVLPTPMSDGEHQALHESAAVLRRYIELLPSDPSANVDAMALAPPVRG